MVSCRKDKTDNVDQRYIVTRSRNLYCHGNGRGRSLFIVVGLYVAVNNIKVFSAATETQHSFPFRMLSRYRIIRAAVHNNK